MRKIWNKIVQKLDEKTKPEKLVLTGDGVKMFFLRLLLMLLVFVVVTTYIIKELTLWQFVAIDALIYIVEAVIKLIREK